MFDNYAPSKILELKILNYRVWYEIITSKYDYSKSYICTIKVI